MLSIRFYPRRTAVSLSILPDQISPKLIIIIPIIALIMQCYAVPYFTVLRAIQAHYCSRAGYCCYKEYIFVCLGRVAQTAVKLLI